MVSLTQQHTAACFLEVCLLFLFHKNAIPAEAGSAAEGPGQDNVQQDHSKLQLGEMMTSGVTFLCLVAEAGSAVEGPGQDSVQQDHGKLHLGQSTGLPRILQALSLLQHSNKSPWMLLRLTLVCGCRGRQRC